MPVIREVTAKSLLTKSGIPGADYCVNPYTGCVHACKYCYATFMGRYSGHTEPWGSFVDVKVNAPDLLRKQIRRVTCGNIIVGSVTDAYQPAEVRYRVTRRCVEVLLSGKFNVSILTKSPLVLRDMDLFRRFEEVEVGMTITTDDDRIRRIFEPQAPPVQARISALKTLHERGIRTYVFIGPVLPMDPRRLGELVRDYCGHVYISAMNYQGKTAGLFESRGLSRWLDRDFVGSVKKTLRQVIGEKASPC